jgi:uncharacterized repeat protein (TIGR01451 family)
MVRSITKRGMPKPFAILIAVLMALYFVPFSALNSANATTPNFEIDGNQVSNGAEDWADLTPTPSGDLADSGGKTNRHLVTFVDNTTVTGQDDTLFGSNNKEEGTGGLQWPHWSPTDNGNATGKSDFGRLAFYSYVEDNHVFFVLGFDRGSNVGGTATDDYYFELNQKAQDLDTDPNPVRTDGDVRIKLDDQGAGNITASLQTWDSSANNGDGGWVAAPSSGNYETASNSGGAIGDLAPWWTGLNVNANGTIDKEGFVEASFDLSSFNVVLGCPSTGFSTVNGRSTTGNSDKNLVDYFRATPLDIPSNCASLVINKVDGNGDPLGGATFSITPNPLPVGTPGRPDGDTVTIVDDSDANTTVDGGNYDDPDATAGQITLPAVVPNVKYTITETVPPDGYVGETGDKTVTPAPFHEGVVSFTNTRKTGSLTISKTTVGGAGTFTFDVDCDGSAYDRTGVNPVVLQVGADATKSVVVASDIPTGTSCTVTERDNPDFTKTAEIPADGTVTIDTDGETVSFTNTRKTGDLKIVKIANATGTFHFDVTCDNGLTQNDIPITIDANHLGSPGVSADLITGIPTGTSCTVTEQEDPDFTTTVTPDDGTVTIGSGDSEVTFSNTRNLGRITIHKVTQGDVAGASTDFTAHVNCTVDAYDQDVTLTAPNWTGLTGDIPTGTQCTITETGIPAGWSLVSITPATVTVGQGDPVAVTITNKRDTGVITVTKTLVGAANGAATSFTFDVDCPETAYDQSVVVSVTNASSASATTTAIPTGLTCTVTERATPDWRMTAVVPAGGVVAVGSTVTFTNTRLEGTLNIAKKVSPVAGNGVVVNFGDTLTYTLTVSATGDQRQPNAVAWDYLPGRDPAHPSSGNTTYVAGSATCIGAGTCTVDGPDASGKITWHLGEMAAGTTRLVTFKVVINNVTGPAGTTIAEDIINQASVQSDRTPATKSNVVVTPVSKVLPVKIGPKELPHTGAFLPVGPTVGGGILLLGLGVLLVATTRRRRELLG